MGAFSLLFVAKSIWFIGGAAALFLLGIFQTIAGSIRLQKLLEDKQDFDQLIDRDLENHEQKLIKKAQ